MGTSGSPVPSPSPPKQDKTREKTNSTWAKQRSVLLPPTHPPTHPPILQQPTHPTPSLQQLIPTASFFLYVSICLLHREQLIQPPTHPPTHPPKTDSPRPKKEARFHPYHSRRKTRDRSGEKRPPPPRSGQSHPPTHPPTYPPIHTLQSTSFNHPPTHPPTHLNRLFSLYPARHCSVCVTYPPTSPSTHPPSSLLLEPLRFYKPYKKRRRKRKGEWLDRWVGGRRRGGGKND